MKKEAFFTASEIGRDLYFNLSIMEYGDIPIIFVLTDDEENMFLCNCTETRELQRWFLSPISMNTLVKLINGKITLLGALAEKNGTTEKIEYNYSTKQFTYDTVNIKQLDESILPDKEAIVCFPTEEAENFAKCHAYDSLRLDHTIHTISCSGSCIFEEKEHYNKIKKDYRNTELPKNIEVDYLVA